jgi:hypothetical protein
LQEDPNPSHATDKFKGGYMKGGGSPKKEKKKKPKEGKKK